MVLDEVDLDMESQEKQKTWSDLNISKERPKLHDMLHKSSFS